MSNPDAGSQPHSRSGKTLESVTGQNPRLIIKNEDIEVDRKEKAIELARAGLKEYSFERELAEKLKREFDRMYGTTWHCVVGKSFGSFVTHETKNFIYFCLEPISILLWKTS